MNHFVDYYEILQVSPAAEPEIIDAAYKKLAQKYHPDVNNNADAAERMKIINAAYDVLGSNEKRRNYHAQWLQERNNTTSTKDNHTKPSTNMTGKKSPSCGDGNNWVELNIIPDWVSEYQNSIYRRYGRRSRDLYTQIFYLWGAKYIYRFQFLGQGGQERAVERRPKENIDTANGYRLPFVNVKTFPRYD